MGCADAVGVLFSARATARGKSHRNERDYRANTGAVKQTGIQDFVPHSGFRRLGR